jgi:hypothetical protein
MRHYNINGSSPETILTDCRGIMAALRTSLDLLNALHPHGRDYQGATKGAYAHDRACFTEAYNSLHDALDYVTEVAVHASGQAGSHS